MAPPMTMLAGALQQRLAQNASPGVGNSRAVDAPMQRRKRPFEDLMMASEAYA